LTECTIKYSVGRLDYWNVGGSGLSGNPDHWRKIPWCN